MRNLNEESPLNNSIDIYIYIYRYINIKVSAFTLHMLTSLF